LLTLLPECAVTRVKSTKSGDNIGGSLRNNHG
jgi:hypothetical protein